MGWTVDVPHEDEMLADGLSYRALWNKACTAVSERLQTAGIRSDNSSETAKSFLYDNMNVVNINSVRLRAFVLSDFYPLNNH